MNRFFHQGIWLSVFLCAKVFAATGTVNVSLDTSKFPNACGPRQSYHNVSCILTKQISCPAQPSGTDQGVSPSLYPIPTWSGKVTLQFPADPALPYCLQCSGFTPSDPRVCKVTSFSCQLQGGNFQAWNNGTNNCVAYPQTTAENKRAYHVKVAGLLGVMLVELHDLLPGRG